VVVGRDWNRVRCPLGKGRRDQAESVRAVSDERWLGWNGRVKEEREAYLM
jgi:hypothetical protein